MSFTTWPLSLSDSTRDLNPHASRRGGYVFSSSYDEVPFFMFNACAPYPVDIGFATTLKLTNDNEQFASY